MNPELSFRGITRRDRHGAFELVGETFEEALNRALAAIVAVIVLSRYKQKLTRAKWDVDQM
jgi:hypothetical protein